MMSEVQIDDYNRLCELEFIDWNSFRDAAIMITGSTGLIGSNLVNAIAYISDQKKLGVRLVLPVRDCEKAHEMFCWVNAEIVEYSLGSELRLDLPVDYIVHLASPTSSRFFVHNPVDTMTANIEGTKALLEYARHQCVNRFAYVSTMEVYGLPDRGHVVRESELGAFETMNTRNSYPIAKIACEALCNSYWNQYGVPTVVLRATQTFGPGVEYNDGRIFAEFMRCALEHRSIVLKSQGLTERSYLYTSDAVSAILVALTSAVPGEAYTVANPDTYCSIRDMAEMVAKKIAGGDVGVEFDLAEDLSKLGYADTLYMNLDVSKLMRHGWYPTVGLEDMFRRMIMGVA